MENYSIKYLYTPDVIRESITAYCRKKYRAFYIILLIFIAAGVLGFLVMRASVWLLLPAIAVCGIAAIEIRNQMNVKKEQNAVKQAFHIASPALHAEFRENDFKVSISNSGKTYPYNSLRGWKETRNLILLFLAGDMCVPLRKDSFTKGDAKSFPAFIMKKI